MMIWWTVRRRIKPVERQRQRQNADVERPFDVIALDAPVDRGHAVAVGVGESVVSASETVCPLNTSK